ncbi:MAG: M23 family metallopeptidase [Actinomycetota bacterium]|nr:M23 family metallopeptidase [Actinomycetota bacterium]
MPGAFVRPSGAVVAGATALLVAALGAVQAAAESPAPPVDAAPVLTARSGVAPAPTHTGTDRVVRSAAGEPAQSGREQVAQVSRSWRREALPVPATSRLPVAAEVRATERWRVLTELAALAEDRAQELRATTWVLPTSGYRITATFGQAGSRWSGEHTGLDFAAPYGTPLVAVAAGTVTEAAYDGAYGYKTVLTLDDGTDVWYCHQADLRVAVGDAVRAGQTIGRIGTTGNSTGPHLHLEVRTPRGTPLDPYAVLAEHGVAP